jgi:hypothetical protein
MELYTGGDEIQIQVVCACAEEIREMELYTGGDEIQIQVICACVVESRRAVF